MARSRNDSVRSIPGWMWLLPAALLVALRLFHLGGPLDDPHSWRQCDTVEYTLGFYRNGIDLLHPAVCWLGAHGTLIFEFPLPEALSAVLYRLGGPHPLWDRLVSLAFFIVATVYLHRFARLVASERAARFATLAYLALPLGVFFSRAAHVDFVATAFMHGLLFHGVRALRDRAGGHLAAGAACGVLGAMIKGPYVIPVLGPLMVAALSVWGIGVVLRGAVLLGVPALAFLGWRMHVNAVNAQVPDWSWMPGFYKEVNPLEWYFGDLGARLEVSSWSTLARRLLREILTPVGAVLALVGVVVRAGEPREHPSARAYMWAWLATTLVYLLVFFTLNVIHNYYQIPLLAPAALAIGLGAAWAWERLPRRAAAAVSTAAFAVFLVTALLMVERLDYYRVDWLRVEAGRAIEARVPEGDLIVAVDHSSAYTDPRLLHRAGRHGWALPVESLDPGLVSRMREIGAGWIAIVCGVDYDVTAPPHLEPSWVGRTDLEHDGQALGTLDLYRLEPDRTEAP